MTQAVIDRLEVIQVEEEDADGRPLTLCSLESVRHTVAEQGAVAQSREGIVQRLPPQLLLEYNAVADVPARTRPRPRPRGRRGGW